MRAGLQGGGHGGGDLGWVWCWEQRGDRVPDAAHDRIGIPARKIEHWFFLQLDAECGEAARGFMTGVNQIEQNVAARTIFAESEAL